MEYICALCVPHDTGPPGWKIAIIQFKTEAYDKVHLHTVTHVHVHVHDHKVFLTKYTCMENKASL